jgi:hypothetical protein
VSITAATQDLDEKAKWRAAAEQARKTAAWAKTMTRVLITKQRSKEPRWEVVNFVGPSRQESRGIVDMLAIRRLHRDVPSPHLPGDLFEIVLIQVKGGKARRPSAADRLRLEAVRTHYGARDVVLAEWKAGAMPSLYRLSGDDWVLTSAAEVFYAATTARRHAPAKKTVTARKVNSRA